MPVRASSCGPYSLTDGKAETFQPVPLGDSPSGNGSVVVTPIRVKLENVRLKEPRYGWS